MRQFTIENTSLSASWTYAGILPSLPVPNTPLFQPLCKALQPFGIKSSGVFVDSPSNKLADVVLTVLLLEDRLKLKFTYSGFEIECSEVYEGDETQIIKIVNLISMVLKEQLTTQDSSTMTIHLRTHLGLPSNEVENLINEHLGQAAKIPNLVPDAFAYNISWPVETPPRNTRFVLAKSLVFNDAIFVDYSTIYTVANDLNATMIKAQEDYWQTLALFGLVESKNTSEEAK